MPIHICVFLLGFHIKLKWLPHIPGNIHRLDFQCSKIIYFSMPVISNQNNINISCGIIFRVIQSNFSQASPMGIFWKKERGGLFRNNPILAKPNRASDNNIIFVVNAAYAKRGVCLVFSAIRYFIIKRT